MHGHGFGILRYWLPAAKRPHVDALVAFAGMADDITDSGLPAAEAARRFQRFQDTFAAAVDRPSRDHDDSAQSAACHAFAHTLTLWGCPAREAVAFLDALGRDLEHTGFETHADVQTYVETVSAPILLWLNTLLEPRSPQAVQAVRALAEAAQVLDHLTDLRDDLARGRLCLPRQDMQRFAVTDDALRAAAATRASSARIRELVLFEAARARPLLDQAAVWPLLVDPRGAELSRVVHAHFAIACDQIIQRQGDVLGRSDRSANLRRARVAFPSLLRATASHLHRLVRT